MHMVRYLRHVAQMRMMLVQVLLPGQSPATGIITQIRNLTWEWYKLAQEKRLQVFAAQDQMQRLCKLQVLGDIAWQKECDPPVPIC